MTMMLVMVGMASRQFAVMLSFRKSNDFDIFLDQRHHHHHHHLQQKNDEEEEEE